ncbi:MAG: hypothetical protein R3F43_22330 [bacterium]
MTFLSFPTALAPRRHLLPPHLVLPRPAPLGPARQGPRAAFGWGFFTGMVINTGSYYWIASLLKIFGGLPDWVALLGLLLHSAASSAVMGPVGLAAQPHHQHHPPGHRVERPLVMVAIDS